MENIWTFLKNIYQSGSQKTMVGFCVFFNLCLFLGTHFFSKSRFNHDYVAFFYKADTTMSLHINKSIAANATNTSFILPTHQATLRNQYQYLQARKNYHERMVERFFALYFTIVTCGMITSVLVGGLLAYIANMGWKATSPSLKAFFVTLGVFTTLYGSILNVFDLKKNAENNLKFFHEYKGIQIEIYDYLTTSGKYLMSTKDTEKAIYIKIEQGQDSIISPKFAIHHINRHIIELNSVFYSISDDAILKSGDLTKLLSQDNLSAGQ